MTQHRRYSIGEIISQTCTFIDGDTLVTLLSPTPDIQYCKELIQFEIDNIINAGDEVKNVLIDCSLMKGSNTVDIRKFYHLEKSICQRDILLYMLDAKTEIRRQLEPVMLNTTWLDSYSIAQMGRDMQNKKSFR